MNTSLIFRRQQMKFFCIALVVALSSALFIHMVNAAEGGGDGLGDSSAITGIEDASGGTEGIRDTIINIVTEALTFVALLATIVIIIGGIYLVAGAGSDSSRERAKNIVIYTIVGLLVIILAAAFVQFIINASSGGGSP
ncbi:hypothetical protein KKC44_03205 [Patescibacteria group bacterium]|nr:hypothetical protein [Patescibacteria group bacterium]